MTEKDVAKTIAKNLRRIFYENGKTQADVARDLQINKGTLSSWMNGTRIPRMNKVDLLCHYFNVSRSDILEDNRGTSPTRIPDVYIMALGGWKTDYVMKSVYRHAFDEKKAQSQDAINAHFEKILSRFLSRFFNVVPD